VKLKDLATKAVNADLSKANLKSAAKSAAKSTAKKHAEKVKEKPAAKAATAAWNGLSDKAKASLYLGVAVIVLIAGLIGGTVAVIGAISAKPEPTCAERQAKAISASQEYDYAVGEGAKVAQSNKIHDLAADYSSHCR
jgi:hypothetical protein